MIVRAVDVAAALSILAIFYSVGWIVRAARRARITLNIPEQIGPPPPPPAPAPISGQEINYNLNLLIENIKYYEDEKNSNSYINAGFTRDDFLKDQTYIRSLIVDLLTNFKKNKIKGDQDQSIDLVNIDFDICLGFRLYNTALSYDYYKDMLSGLFDTQVISFINQITNLCSDSSYIPGCSVNDLFKKCISESKNHLSSDQNRECIFRKYNECKPQIS